GNSDVASGPPGSVHGTEFRRRIQTKLIRLVGYCYVAPMPTTTRAKGPAKEPPSWDLILKRNAIERHKKEKFPLDIIDELPDMIERGYEAIPEEDIVFLSWYGLMHDKPKIGTFMVRVKVPGGRITPDQLRALGHISTDQGRNYGELTT